MEPACKGNNMLLQERLFLLLILTWKPVKGSLANIADPGQTPHYVASDQGLHCLLTGFSIKNRIKATK